MFKFCWLPAKQFICAAPRASTKYALINYTAMASASKVCFGQQTVQMTGICWSKTSPAHMLVKLWSTILQGHTKKNFQLCCQGSYTVSYALINFAVTAITRLYAL